MWPKRQQEGTAVKRTIVAIGSAIVMIAFSVTLGGAAWSATSSSIPPAHRGGRRPPLVHAAAPRRPRQHHRPRRPPSRHPPRPPRWSRPRPQCRSSRRRSRGTPPNPRHRSPPFPRRPPSPWRSPLTQLPFTGRNIKPFLFAGLLLVGLGLALLAPSDFWRRGRRLPRVLLRATRQVSATGMTRSSAVPADPRRHLHGGHLVLRDLTIERGGSDDPTRLGGAARIVVPHSPADPEPAGRVAPLPTAGPTTSDPTSRVLTGR